MIHTPTVTLTHRAVEAVVIPSEGGVLSRLRVAGRDVLATTPWARDRPPTPAALREEEWVERWRGGWQLCFPSAGEADAKSAWPQGFHGVASQSTWQVTAVERARVELEWNDEHSLIARRSWQLTDTGAHVSTTAENDGAVRRPLVIAEHLILGGDLLRPVIRDAAALTLTAPPGTRLAPLDYAGNPDGDRQPWPGSPADRWTRVDRETPARVAALVDVEPCVIRVDGPHVSATITWSGLAHALVWEELARSSEPPWDGSVTALGIEPTSAPHGRGTALAEGTVWLEPGQSLTWSTTLAVEWLDGTAPPSTEESS